MKHSELQNQSEAELQERLQAARVRLGKLRFELANKALKNFSQIGKTRREIARLMTALNQTKVISKKP